MLTQHLSASVTYIQLDWLYSIANITAYQWARKPVMSLSCDFTHFCWNYMQSTPDQNKVVFLALMMNAISPIGQIYQCIYTSSPCLNTLKNMMFRPKSLFMKPHMPHFQTHTEHGSWTLLLVDECSHGVPALITIPLCLKGYSHLVKWWHIAQFVVRGVEPLGPPILRMKEPQC